MGQHVQQPQLVAALGRREAVAARHQPVATLGEGRKRGKIAPHQHAAARNAQQAAQQRGRTGEGFLQVILGQDFLHDGVERGGRATLGAGLAQAVAQQAVGNIGALLFIGGFFVGVAAPQHVGQGFGMGRTSVLDLQVVHRVQGLILLVVAGLFLGLPQRTPGQARHAGSEQVLGQGKVAAHGGGGRGVVLALAQHQEIGEMQQQALAHGVVGHGVGRGRVEACHQRGRGQGGARQQPIEAHVLPAGHPLALAQKKPLKLGAVVGAKGKQGSAEVVNGPQRKQKTGSDFAEAW